MPGVKNISIQITVMMVGVDVHYVIMKNVWSRLEFAAAKTLQVMPLSSKPYKLCRYHPFKVRHYLSSKDVMT